MKAVIVLAALALTGNFAQAGNLCVINKASQPEAKDLVFDKTISSFEISDSSKFLILRGEKAEVVELSSLTTREKLQAVNGSVYVYVNAEKDGVNSIGLGQVDTSQPNFLENETIAFGKIAKGAFLGLTDLKRGLSISCTTY